MQEDIEALKSTYIFINKAIHSTLTPVLVLIAILSPHFVTWVFGAKWEGAILLIQIFTGIAIIQSFLSPVGELMKALGRPEWLLNWSVFFTFSTIFCLGVGSYWNIHGCGIGLAIANMMGLPLHCWIVAKLIQMNLKEMLRALFPSFVASSLSGVLLSLFLRFDILSGGVRIAVGLIVSIASFVLILKWLDNVFISAFLKKGMHEISD
jgi:O-antigen/teichoic acid export membrane protein